MHKYLLVALLPLLAQAAGPLAAPKPLSKDPPKPAAVKPFEMGAPTVVLLVSGGDNGLLEVCDCPGEMPGGLSRRSGLAVSYRAAFPNVFVLDAGNGFVRGGDSLINDFHMHGFRQIGYDAVVLGEYEWASPATRLQTIVTEGKLEYLSTTVREKTTAAGKTPLPLARVVKRQFGPAKLAVVSDLRAQWKPNIPNSRQAELAFTPEAELTALTDQLHREGWFVIVVCHGEEAALKDTARACPSAGLFIRGLRSPAAEKLLTFDGRPLVSVWGNQYSGALAMKFAPDGKLEKLEYRRETVGPKWPIDERLLQTYRDYCAVAMRAALQSKPKPGPVFAGAAQCGVCHKPQYENWKASKHALAYKTLEREKRTDDPACISCHTTGFGTVKGFVTIEKTPKLAGVNCQDCHAHDAVQHIQKQVLGPRPSEATCRICHTEVTDPRFDYAKRTKEYHCPLGKPPRPGAASQPATQPAK